jgi:hypothetical protein
MVFESLCAHKKTKTVLVAESLNKGVK